MGYIVISKDGIQRQAVGPCTLDQAKWFFDFNSYEEPDESGVRKGNAEDPYMDGVSGIFQESLPEKLPLSRYVQMM